MSALDFSRRRSQARNMAFFSMGSNSWAIALLPKSIKSCQMNEEVGKQ
jgi:hypothetical protein